MIHLETQADLDSGVRRLIKLDTRFKDVVAVAGRPLIRRRAGGFAGLASIIVAQQLSTASANAIWARLTAAFDPLDPDKIRRSRATTLARLSRVPSRTRICSPLTSGLS